MCGAAGANARDGFGLGIIIGEPTGVSAKAWLSDENALDFAAAWSLEGRDAFHFHADYLWHAFNVIKPDRGWMPIFFGIGARLLIHDDDHDRDHDDDDFDDDDDVHFGVRVPVGLEYIFVQAPVGIFLEVAPIVDLVPDTDLDFNAGIGARFFF
ncbi:MAG: DUF3996 domain-containing protein [Candidatus Zixiibacteriota bacterium]|nr:MAG: DUF3996 domain-containing protein [candidate division Zixibacteria bacterium]